MANFKSQKQLENSINNKLNFKFVVYQESKNVFKVAHITDLPKGKTVVKEDDYSACEKIRQSLMN